MTKLQSWMMSGLAVAALGIGVLLASSAISSAQEGSDTPTPTPSEEANGDDSTATPEATEDAAEPEDEADADDADADDAEDEDAAGEEEKSGCGGGGKYLVKEAAAEVLGLSEDEVREALRDGQTLAELAEAQGMSVEDFRSALLAAVTADLQAKLDAGDITQEEFDEAIAQLNENIDDIINSEGGLRFRRSFDADGDGDGGVRFRAPFEQDPVGSGT